MSAHGVLALSRALHRARDLQQVMVLGNAELASAELQNHSARSARMQVLLMTGYAPSRLGPVHWPHITKPFTPTELLTRSRSQLAAQRDASASAPV